MKLTELLEKLAHNTEIRLTDTDCNTITEFKPEQLPYMSHYQIIELANYNVYSIHIINKALLIEVGEK